MSNIKKVKLVEEDTVDSQIFNDDYNRIWVLLHQAAETLDRARNKELEQYEITVTQSAILFALKAMGDKATMIDLAKWNMRKPHSIANILHRMERHGLIKRTKPKKAKQSINFALTEKGEAVYSQTAKRESIYEVMSSFSKEDLKLLEKFLRIVKDKAQTQLLGEIQPLFP
jgi:DNA-binding MarR family transcriptional regulator